MYGPLDFTDLTAHNTLPWSNTLVHIYLCPTKWCRICKPSLSVMSNSVGDEHFACKHLGPNHFTNTLA